jgi:GTPase SAR1 family protein
MRSAQLRTFNDHDDNKAAQRIQGSSNALKIASALSTLGDRQLADEIAAYGVTENDRALRVTVFGEYSVGKSTLINALVGRQLLAAKLRPTTGVPTEVRWGADEVNVIFRNGRQTQVSLVEADTYSNLGVENRARDEVERIVISTRLPQEWITLIDTPGLLDDDRQTERARREVASADVVLLVLKADSLLRQTARSFAVDWLTQDLKKPVVPVINFLGLTDASDHAELRESLRRFTASLVQPFGKPWYEVDALPALRHRLNQPGASTPDDDYEQLSAVLAGLSRDRIRKLKEQSRIVGRQAGNAERARTISSS